VVREVLQHYLPGYEVRVFGSRARHTAKPYSDLDLAVMTNMPLSLEVQARINDAFAESDLPWRVDLLDWAATSDAFRDAVERDYVVVQEGD
jgi:type I restriction enzyme S subunit